MGDELCFYRDRLSYFDDDKSDLIFISGSILSFVVLVKSYEQVYLLFALCTSALEANKDVLHMV